MTTNQKKAQKHAENIKWNCDEALEYAIALLEECNLHTEVAALVAANEQKNKEDAEMLSKLFA